VKSLGSQVSVTDETVQFLTDHGFGELRYDLPHHALDDLGRELEHAFDLIGSEAEGLKPLHDRM
jgi:hypothetical protein